MKRIFGPIHQVVTVGVLAIIGAFLVSSPRVQAEPGNDIMAAMYWLQPALGEAIVEQAVLEREWSRTMGAAVTDLNRAMRRWDRMEQHPFAYLDDIRRWDTISAANHAARVQMVMGRYIVNGTLRGVHAGLLPLSEDAGSYTRRLVTNAETWGKRLDQQYVAARQVNLGGAIVEAAKAQTAFMGKAQERLGRTMLQVATLQTDYRDAFRRNEEQTAALVTAVVRTEARADLFARLMQLDPVPAPASLAATSPSVPTSHPTAMTSAALSWGMIGLVLLFVSALKFTGRFEGKTA